MLELMSNSIAYVSVLLKTYTDDALSAIIKKEIWKLKREEKRREYVF